MMHHVPPGVQQPAYTDKCIAIEPTECDNAHDDAKHKLPQPQATAQIGGTCASYSEGTDPAPVRIGNEGCSQDPYQCYDHCAYSLRERKIRNDMYCHE